MKKSNIVVAALFVVFAAGVIFVSCGNGTTGGGESIEVTFVNADPARGFNYGYYYYVPQSIWNSSKRYLMIAPNNSGGFTNYDMDDTQTHTEAALRMMNSRISWAHELGCALLVPVIPRPYRTPPVIEPQILNRVALQTTTGNPARVDLQLICMIDDVKEICKNIGINLEAKIIIEGFSAGGVFGNRFTALHPELVRAVVSGGINCMPILPANTLEGERLIYPVGVSDLAEIAGSSFNAQQYKAVPQFIYMGAEDPLDPLESSHYFGDEERRIIKKVLGINKWDRWEQAQSVYAAQDCSAVQFKTYDNIGHEYTSSMVRDIITFLKGNM